MKKYLIVSDVRDYDKYVDTLDEVREYFDFYGYLSHLTDDEAHRWIRTVERQGYNALLSSDRRHTEVVVIDMSYISIM